MSSILRRSILPVLAVPAMLSAQSPAPAAAAKPMEWALIGAAGGAQRSEAGRQENGSRITGGLMRFRPDPQVGEISAQEVTIGFAQMNSSAGRYALRENSFEIAAMVSMLAMRQSYWHLDAALGLVASSSFGCATDKADSLVVPGSVSCVHDYAKSGTTRIGYRGRVMSLWAGPVTSVFVAVDLTGNTVAAGNTIIPTYVLGARYSLGPVGR